MNKEAFPHVGETMYHQVMENGLNVFVFPKPEFQKGYAFFATNYGGMDRRFCLDGVWHDTPAGVAHYLEHKMFDTQDGNALQELAANGASPNAFTSSAITLSPPRSSTKTCVSSSPSCQSPGSPRRAWTRSRASSARRSA